MDRGNSSQKTMTPRTASGGPVCVKERKPDKEHVARTPQAVAKYKELFLKQLALGRSPGFAARVVKIARATAYAWKNQDPEFDAAWVDAVETGLDLLEDSVFERGLKEGGEDARFILKHRRYNNKSPEVRSNFLLHVTDEEHQARLERLGLALPLRAVREGDYDEEDAPAGKTDFGGVRQA